MESPGRRVFRAVPLLLILILAAFPAVAAKKLKVTGGGNNVDVTNDDPNGHFKSFRYTPNDATITVGATTLTAVFEKDGAVTLNGVKCATNDELLAVIARTPLAAVTAEELDAFIAQMQSGEIRFEPKKRNDSFLQLLTTWRSRI